MDSSIKVPTLGSRECVAIVPESKVGDEELEHDTHRVADALGVPYSDLKPLFIDRDKIDMVNTLMGNEVKYIACEKSPAFPLSCRFMCFSDGSFGVVSCHALRAEGSFSVTYVNNSGDIRKLSPNSLKGLPLNKFVGWGSGNKVSKLVSGIYSGGGKLAPHYISETPILLIRSQDPDYVSHPVKVEMFDLVEPIPDDTKAPLDVIEVVVSSEDFNAIVGRSVTGAYLPHADPINLPNNINQAIIR